MNDNLSIDSGLDRLTAGSRLSPQQAHVWALHRAGAALHVCCAVEIDGHLDPEQLRRALTSVCEDHPILRSKLVHQPGTLLPLQTQCDSVVWIDTLDIAHLSLAEQTVQLDDLWSSQIEFKQDWAASPALRAQLVRLNQSKSILIFNLCPMFGD